LTEKNAAKTEYSLTDLGIFTITDERTGAVYTGGSQEWYGRLWQRMSGCGPTAASNIFKYLGASCLPAGTIRGTATRSDFQALMKEVWNFVTPTRHGVNSTDIFEDGCVRFAESKGFCVTCGCLDISGSNDFRRPPFSKVVSFIAEALDHDLPVAFLSLDSGSEKVIDHWHWITIAAMRGDEEDMDIDFLDASTVKHASLSGWYRTTKEGGGFVTVRPE
jgi:hypothetical protein